MPARRRRCRVAWCAFVGLAGNGPAARPAAAETVSAIGSFGPSQELLDSGTTDSVIASAEDDPSAGSAETIDVADGSGSFKWQSGVVVPDGTIYACPLHARVVLKVDPVTDTISVFGDEGSGNFKWRHAVLASNGNIYCIPDSASTVLKIDPVSDTTSHFGDLGSGAYKWKHAVIAASGAIYGIPFHASSVLKIDPFAETATTNLPSISVNDFGTDRAKWQHGVLASSTGVIYGIPCSADSVLRVDPATDIVVTFSDVSSAGTSYKWLHGVEAHNGVIYAVPYSANAVLKIEPDSDTVTLIDSFRNTGTFQWQFSVLSFTGAIYGLPDKAESVLRIGPGNSSSAQADNVTLLGSFPGSHYKYRDGAVVEDGLIYGIPFQAGSVLKIDPATDSAVTFASFGDSQLSKWRGAVVAANGAVYAFPSGAGSVLKVDPEGTEAPGDGWADAALTTAGAGMVGASIAFIAFAAFCGVALILRKRWQQKTTRRQERVEKIYASKPESASASKESTGNGFSHYSTADTFAQGPSAGHSGYSGVSRAAMSSGSSWHSPAPLPETLPSSSTAPSFAVSARPTPAPFPHTAPETGFFGPPSTTEFHRAHSGFSHVHSAAHLAGAQRSSPSVNSFSSRPLRGRPLGPPPLEEVEHNDGAAAMSNLRARGGATGSFSPSRSMMMPPGSFHGPPSYIPPSSTTSSRPSMGLSDLRNMSGFAIGAPPEGMELPPPPPYVPKSVRRQVERLHQTITSSSSPGSPSSSPPVPPPRGP